MRIGHDVESYINYFCVGIEDYDTGEKKLFEISEERNDIHKVFEYYSKLNASVVSFNGIYYDNLIIKYLILNYNRFKNVPWQQITIDVKRFSDKVIEDNNFDDELRNVKRFKHLWLDIDLFLYWSKGLRLSKKISLKSLGIQLGYDVVQELPFSPTSTLQWKDLPRIREYNMVHDLGILKLLYDNMIKDVELREYIQESLHIPCMSMDAPKIASEVLLKDYCDLYKYKPWDIRKWSFDRNAAIPLRSVLVGFNPNFQTKQFIDMFEKWNNSYDKVSDEFIYREGITELTLTFGIGGLHSVNENEKYYSNDTHIVMTSDVASLYPNLIINYKCIRFPEVLEKYKNIMIERLIAKKNKEKTKDTFFKLILNSISGLLDDKHSWLYFPEGALRMRLIGQLILSKFIETCALAGWKVVSANT